MSAKKPFLVDELYPILEPWVVDLIIVAEVMESEYIVLDSAEQFQIASAYLCGDKMIYCRGIDRCNQRVYFSPMFGG